MDVGRQLVDRVIAVIHLRADGIYHLFDKLFFRMVELGLLRFDVGRDRKLVPGMVSQLEKAVDFLLVFSFHLFLTTLEINR